LPAGSGNQQHTAEHDGTTTAGLHPSASRSSKEKRCNAPLLVAKDGLAHVLRAAVQSSLLRNIEQHNEPSDAKIATPIKPTTTEKPNKQTVRIHTLKPLKNRTKH
jgi:hypothetical protein